MSNLQTEPPLLFLHIPKTAGTTFNAYLSQYAAPDVICPAFYWHEFLQLPAQTRKRYRIVRGHFGYNMRGLLAQTPTTITFLRDPIERTISHFEQRRRSGRGNLVDFETFRVYPETQRILPHYQTRILAVPIDFETNQAQLIADSQAIFHPLETWVDHTMDETELLDTAKHHLESIEFVGLTGRFQESLNLITHGLGWRPFTVDERRNVSRDRLQFDDLNAQQQDTVMAWCRLDLELYDFARELFERRLLAFQQHILHESYARRVMQDAQSTFHCDMTTITPNSGWHQAEAHPETGIVRWTAQTEALIEAPIQSAAHCELAIHVVGFITPQAQASFRVLANDTSITLTADDSGIYRGRLPAALLAEHQPLLLRLCVDVTTAPVDLGLGDDPRQLGVAVASVTVTPINA